MKKRIDLILVNQGLVPSRAKAAAFIKAGHVYVNGELVARANKLFDEDDISIELSQIEAKYVSRGGLKLEKAVTNFAICLKDKVCLDIGASTGGFTDCMLKQGALKVYAVDSGQNQLDSLLKNDTRVINIEKLNFRFMQPEDLPEPIYFAAVDVSFISLKLILPAAYHILPPGSGMVCLIKPQFEVGIDRVAKNGIIKDKKAHYQVIKEIIDFAEKMGFTILNLDFSPLRGGKDGNIEYLLHLGKQTSIDANVKIDHRATVMKAHEFFKLERAK